MAREMIKANTRLFQGLSRFCSDNAISIEPIDGYRYVEGDDESDVIIQNLKIAERIEFGPRRVAALATIGDDHLLVLIGYDHLDDFVNVYSEFGEDVEQIDCLPGHVVTLLSELDMRPIVNGRRVQSFIEFSDSGTSGYEGHPVDELQELYPLISVFRARGALDQASFVQLVAKFSAAESAYGGGWIREPLLVELLALASLSASTFPHEAVSRAVFDSDPRNLYLALYRCVEATYAYRTSTQLAMALGLNAHWADLAIKLEQNLGWRPRESSSLEVVLQHASEADLKKVLDAISKDQGDVSVARAASAIYKLRNRIVHFNASRDSVTISDYDWNAVCSALTGVVYDVFHHAFAPIASP